MLMVSDDAMDQVSFSLTTFSTTSYKYGAISYDSGQILCALHSGITFLDNQKTTGADLVKHIRVEIESDFYLITALNSS